MATDTFERNLVLLQCQELCVIFDLIETFVYRCNIRVGMVNLRCTCMSG